MLDPAAFRHPPATYRAAPLWSWNARLEPDELRRQIQEMARGGFGGFFMHPRPGLETPFLSPDWFDAVRLSLDEAQRHGLAAWVYDECSYPSGFAGGLVPERFPDLRAKALTCHLATAGDSPPVPHPSQGAYVAAFAARPAPASAGVLQHYRRLDPMLDGGTLHATLWPDEVLLVFSWWYMAPQTWFNDSAYVDTLDPRTAPAFLEVAYEPYAKRFAEHFGHTIPGAFSDEPHFRPFATGSHEAFSWPWTPSLPDLFAASHIAGAAHSPNGTGHAGTPSHESDIISRLPELAFDLAAPTGDPPAALRYRFWSTVARQFYEAFCRPMAQWCERHGLHWTGHYWDHAFSPRSTGSLMLPLAAMQIPGIDLLGPDRPLGKLPNADVQPQAGQAQMVKVASSVAHQLGRPRVLSETYGGGGWDLSLQGQKRMAEWQAVLGVNFLNPHLVHYSLRGYRKRDHPPSFLDLDPWWPEFPHLQDYLARLHYALSQGTYHAELALLHPITSTWLSRPEPLQPALHLTAGKADIALDRQLAKALDSLVKDLLASQWSFDFLDEPLVPDLAQPAPGGLAVGQMRYRALVLPPCRNLAPETVTLIRGLLDAGCPIYAVAQLPSCVAGRPDPELNSLWPQLHVCPDTAALLQTLAAQHTRPAIVPHAPPGLEVYAHVRDLAPDTQAIYLLNCGEGEAERLPVTLPSAAGASVESWDPTTGEHAPLAVDHQELPTVHLDFARGQSHLLVLHTAAAPPGSAGGRMRAAQRAGPWVPAEVVGGRPPPLREAAPLPTRTLPLSNTWTLRRATPNALVLDRAQFRWGDQPWSEPHWLPIIQEQVRARLGWDNLQFREAHPWRKFATRPPRVAAEPLTLRWRVLVDPTLDTAALADLRLAVELGEGWHVLVNGRQPDLASGRWLSHDYTLLTAGPLLHSGENWLELHATYAEDSWLEAMYLLGDFALSIATSASETTPASPADAAENGILSLPLLAGGWPQASLMPAPASLTDGPWATQGYPFFGGRLVIGQQVVLDPVPDQAWLTFDTLPCAALRVRCNGIDAGVIAWRPYRLPLSGLLRPGTNHLELEIAGSLRNVLGPLHADVRQVPIVGPGHFLPGRLWQDAYILTPEGVPTGAHLLLH